jgi:predicted anti-sigma-YlaC factor YlaD
VADTTCPRETELLDVISAGRTPDGELANHLDACSGCNDLFTVAAAILDDRNAAIHEANIPPSGAIWWRMQMRAYYDAQRTASRTATVVQAVVLLGALLVAGAILGRQTLVTAFTAITRIPLAPWSIPLAVAIALLAIVTPAVLWVAMADGKAERRGQKAEGASL